MRWGGVRVCAWSRHVCLRQHSPGLRAQSMRSGTASFKKDTQRGAGECTVQVLFVSIGGHAVAKRNCGFESVVSKPFGCCSENRGTHAP